MLYFYTIHAFYASSCSQFHQHYTREFFVWIFQQSQNITRKTTCVQKIRMYNVDEIDTWWILFRNCENKRNKMWLIEIDVFTFFSFSFFWHPRLLSFQLFFAVVVHVVFVSCFLFLDKIYWRLLCFSSFNISLCQWLNRATKY